LPPCAHIQREQLALVVQGHAQLIQKFHECRGIGRHHCLGAHLAHVRVARCSQQTKTTSARQASRTDMRWVRVPRGISSIGSSAAKRGCSDTAPRSRCSSRASPAQRPARRPGGSVYERNSAQTTRKQVSPTQASKHHRQILLACKSALTPVLQASKRLHAPAI